MIKILEGIGKLVFIIILMIIVIILYAVGLLFPTLLKDKKDG